MIVDAGKRWVFDSVMNKKQKILTVVFVIFIAMMAFNFTQYSNPDLSPYGVGLVFFGIVYVALFFVLKPTKKD